LYTGNAIFKQAYTYFIYFLLAIGVGWEVVLRRDRRAMEKALQDREKEVEEGRAGDEKEGEKDREM
jgi:hypothetical protein